MSIATITCLNFVKFIRLMVNYYEENNITLPAKTRPGVNTAVVLYNLERYVVVY